MTTRHKTAPVLLSAISALFLILQTASAAPSPKLLPEWTFLVFLNGHNNLDSFGALNINQMEQVGSTDKVKVVVQWASLKEGNTKRLLIQRDNDTRRVTSPVVQDMGYRVNMGSDQSLEDFVNWGMKKFPAKQTFVAVWNHGSGWHKLRQRGSPELDPLLTREISSDDLTGSIITTEQLGKVLVRVAQKTRRKIDIVGADACLMAMAEVIGEFAHSASYFVGSQELEPGYGWPYADFLNRWNEMSDRTPANVSRALVDAYAMSYQGGSNGTQEVTLSAVDLRRWSGFVAASKKFVLSTLEWSQEDKQNALQAARASLHFNFSDYVDLGDWLSRIPHASGTAALQRALGELVISNGVTPQYSRAKGLTVWLPQSDPTLRRYLTRYEHLVWDQTTLWSIVGQGINWQDLPKQ